MSKILNVISQLFCPCKMEDSIRKTEGRRYYTQCTRCLRTTQGVEVGGFHYGKKAVA
jgi:hypothetical protein